MALDAATAKEMIQKLSEDRANYLDTLSRAHDVLAKALDAAATGKPPPRLTPETVRRNTNATIDVESVKNASSTFSPEDSDTGDDESMFVQQTLPSESFDDEGLKKHIQEYNWTEQGKAILGNVINNKQLLQRSSILPVTLGTQEDRSHLSHYSIFDVGNDGAPLEVQRASDKETSRAQTIWNLIKSVNSDPTRERKAVGRITIVREPSPGLFAALHYTMSPHFDVDELFAMLVEDKNRSSAHRPFSADHRHQRTFIFTLDFFTVIGDDCVPEKWQGSDEDSKSSESHVPLSRCSSVIALSLSGEAIRVVKNRSRRAQRSTGYVFDPFAPWRVLSIQSYPDWKHSIDAHNSTKHYVNGPEAFLITLRAEFKDAGKRLMDVYNRISELVKMPGNFMFNLSVRDRLLFEDEEFTFSRRYFWAHQSLGIMNENIQEILLQYRENFTDHVWDGSSKVTWPGDESVSSRYANWRKRMKGLRADIENELHHLEKIMQMNNEKMAEIKGLRDNLFSGTSVLESRRSVDQAMITVQQGHNIKLLTLVTIFFLPLTFVTSVFGMTNMSQTASFRDFGIVTAAVCLPTYMLIGSLNTYSGVQFWRQKTRQFFHAVSAFFARIFAVFGYQPEWAKPPPLEPDPTMPKPLKHRSTATGEAMEARRDGSGPLLHSPTSLHRPTFGPSHSIEGSHPNNLPRTLTSATTVRFDDEKNAGPQHLIRKLGHGDHRRTDSWGTTNGHRGLDRRSTTFSSSPTSLRRNDTYRDTGKDTGSEGEGRWVKRVFSWGSSTKKGKGERELC